MRITLNHSTKRADEFVRICRKFKSDIELTAVGKMTVDAKNPMDVYLVLTYDDLDVEINGITTSEQNRFVDIMREKFSVSAEAPESSIFPVKIPAVRKDVEGYPCFFASMTYGQIAGLIKEETALATIPHIQILSVLSNTRVQWEQNSIFEDIPFGYIELSGSESFSLIANRSYVESINDALKKDASLASKEVTVLIFE